MKEIIAVGRDITEKKQTENDLLIAKNQIEESEHKFRNLFENFPIGLSITGLDNKIHANQAFYEMLGYTKDEFNNITWQQITHPDDIQKTNEIINILLSGTIEKAKFEKRYVHKNGQTIWAEVSTFLQRDTNNHPLFLITAIMDINERKHTEKELIAAKEKAEESEKLKTAFLQNLSHEIRTPLNAISGFAGLLDKPDLSIEKRKSFVSIIQNSTKQLLSIVNDILTISSLETKQERLNIEKVCINEIIISLLSIFKQQAINQNISIYTRQHLNDKQAEIYTDKTKVTQILSNLISNALKFTHEGFIEIGYNLINNELVFYVKDSGIGIKPELQEKIFERFRQADLTISQKYGGTGLGLAISKGFVELLGGKIWVNSEIGKGSTFNFTIPYKPVNKINELIISNGSNSVNKKPIILVAEDEEFNFLYIEELLIDFDYQIIHAKDGQETIDMFKTNPRISLILMDIKMPIIDGYKVAKLIKELNPNLPIIAHSAYALEHEIKKYSEIFDDYLTKPINDNILKQTIMKYIPKK